MSFTLLPAVDVAAGSAARHAHLDTDGDDRDPLAIALALQSDGAEWIHLVDLDAAFGRGTNLDLLAHIVGELDIAVQVSGGVHDDDSLERALSTGCARVNISTAALRDPTWCTNEIATHGDRVSVSLDVRGVADPTGTIQYRLAPRGASTDVADLWTTIDHLDAAGCARYVVTGVAGDGRLSGPDLDLYHAVTKATSTPLIASGGVSSVLDLAVLAAIGNDTSLDGAIVGTALIDGRFTLPDALDAVRGIRSSEPHPPR